MDVQRYLDHILVPGTPSLDLASLAALQRAHLEAVPFENLHVFHRRPVGVDTAWSIPKILSGRGGWCFELNGAFSELLADLGFSVDRVGADVLLDGERESGPDHLAMLVHLDQSYLVDVGFGASFTQPLLLHGSFPQSEDHGQYRVVADEDERHLLQFRATTGESWADQYRFSETPAPLDAFASRSRYLATEPGLKWTESPFATRLIPGGRVTLLGDRLKIRRDGFETVTDVAPHDWAAVLMQWFEMTP